MELLPIVKETADAHGLHYEVLACDPDMADTAAFCEHYGFTLEQSANAILVASRKIEPTKYAVCVVLGTTKLDVNKKVCQLLEIKRASFADAAVTRELTGMEIGGVTPVGISNLPVYVDSAVMDQTVVVMGGGNRSSKLLLNPQELTKLPNVMVVSSLAKPAE